MRNRTNPMIRLGVNIDHIATLRQARRGFEPNPLEGAFVCEKAGAHGITIHLREDRRHIQDKDVYVIKEQVLLPLNLEMALNPDIVKIALDVRPSTICLVPEKRQELTTEGGLDVAGNKKEISSLVSRMHKKGIGVSLFINAAEVQVKASCDAGADYVELHTGEYSNAKTPKQLHEELARLEAAAACAHALGLTVNAGHGLNYQNTPAILHLEGLHELNIGHSIISRSLFTGLYQAVSDMLILLS